MPRYGNTSCSGVSLDKIPHMNTSKLHAGRVNRPALTRRPSLASWRHVRPVCKLKQTYSVFRRLASSSSAPSRSGS
eukprot:4056744-Prymnesium_polylepis.1